MRTRFVAAVGPAVLALGLAVAVTQIARGDSPAPGERPDAGRPAAAPASAPESSPVYGDAQAVQQGAAAAAYADAMAQAEIQRYWQAIDDAHKAEAARQGSGSGSGSGSGRSRCADPLACIRECESHGNYGSVSRGGTYRGAYQFSQTAWESVGGTGDPAAAPAAEQDARAAALYSQRGSAPWANCA